MTEQFMEDLTNEEHEALLLMSEHGIAPPLSPAAQAVVAAAYALPLKNGQPDIAAALRAAANQVVPDIGYEADCLDEPVESELQCIRNRFLAIADELEGQ
jgi:hypothetical protein